MQTPPYLKKKDKIRIVAPARKISQGEVGASKNVFESWGLHVEYGRHLFGKHHQFSGTDAERLEDFQAALDDPEVRAIVCARGGYGSVRIIDDLDFSRFQQAPKWIIGYSDITVFHSHINRHYNTETLHAEMPLNFGKKKTKAETIKSLKAALFGKKISYGFPGNAKNRPGSATGKLCGGNLSMLYSLNGSPSDIETEGKILFLEDLDEYLYHVDRMMMNLKRSDKFARPAAVMIGGMSDMNDNAVAFGKNAQEIICDILGETDYPLCFGFPAGHIPDNRALIMGREASLEINESGARLEFGEE